MPAVAGRPGAALHHRQQPCPIGLQDFDDVGDSVMERTHLFVFIEGIRAAATAAEHRADQLLGLTGAPLQWSADDAQISVVDEEPAGPQRSGVAPVEFSRERVADHAWQGWRDGAPDDVRHHREAACSEAAQQDVARGEPGVDLGHVSCLEAEAVELQDRDIKPVARLDRLVVDMARVGNVRGDRFLAPRHCPEGQLVEERRESHGAYTL
jgi:hypothetical protein